MDPRERLENLARLLVLAGAVLALALPAGASAAPPVHSARFTYELCDSALPGGGHPALSFTVNPTTPMGYFDNCQVPGGSVGISEWGHAEATFSMLSVGVPETPGGFVETEAISAGAFGMGPANDHPFVYEQPWPIPGEPEATRTFFIRRERQLFFGNGGSFTILLNCDGNVGPCEAGPVIYAHYIAATEVDPNPPTLTAIHGSLLDTGTLRGSQSIGFEGHDEGGGLTSLSVLVNGKPAGAPKALACNTASVSNSSVKGTVAVAITPCPTSAKGEWTINTESQPFHLGANSVQVCASDFATIGEPNTTCSAAQTVNVDNSCTNSPVAGGELLSAQFTKSHRETLTVGFGKEAEVVGTLRTNSGDPVGGAALCVKMQTLGVDARASAVGTVQTDDNGNYSYKVPAGPNRDVVIGYRHDTAQVARDVRYYAHARPSLHASPGKLQNGDWVHFWGRLPGPHRRGRVVVLQANVVGSKRWITFRKATSARKGIFRAAYHFTSTTQATTYRFRAVVPVQDGYPWVQGHSKPLSVKVSR
jgi:hypothetical protein